MERAFSPEPVKLRRPWAEPRERSPGSRRRRDPARGRRPASAPPAEARQAATNGAQGPPRRERLAEPRRRFCGCRRCKATFYPDDEVGWVPFAIAQRSRSPPRVAPRRHLFELAARLVPPRRRGARPPDRPAVGRRLPRSVDRQRLCRAAERHARVAAAEIERRIVDNAAAGRLRFRGLDGGLLGTLSVGPRAFRHDPERLRPGRLRGARAVEPAAGAGATCRAADGRFHLVYGGSIYGEHELELFLEGLERSWPAGRRSATGSRSSSSAG